MTNRGFFTIAGVLMTLSAPASPVFAQRLTPSVYVGLGNFTNLGGQVGVGVELRVGEYLSLSGAAGYLRTDSLEEPEEARRDFDAGVKVYPMREWLYFGLNYGLVDYWVDDRLSPPPIHRTHAFSFTAGVRTPAWRALYTSAYLGATSDAESNRFFDSFMPRLGLMVGYELGN